MSLNPETAITFSPLHRLQWEEAQQKHVILYPEGMVELNPTAAEIMRLCDGQHSLLDIVRLLEQKFETTGLEEDIRGMLEAAMKHGWINQN